MNKIILTGRLVNTPEIRRAGETVLAKGGIAVARAFKSKSGQVETDFFDFTIFGSLSNSFCTICDKGDLVLIEGELRNNLYKNDSGQTIKSTNIIVSRFEIQNKNIKNSKSIVDEELSSVDSTPDELPF